jgi:hypothetical protein
LIAVSHALLAAIHGGCVIVDSTIGKKYVEGKESGGGRRSEVEGILFVD